MNRCITCGKIVTRKKAQNIVKWENHKFMVCCPMCEKEFNREPEYYLAVAKSLFGEYGLKAHSHTAITKDSVESASTPNETDLMTSGIMLHNFHMEYERILQNYKELKNHFNNLANSGGMEGLRSELQKHRNMMDSLQKEMSVQSGVCKFIISVAESSNRIGV